MDKFMVTFSTIGLIGSIIGGLYAEYDWICKFGSLDRFFYFWIVGGWFLMFLINVLWWGFWYAKYKEEKE